MKISAFLPALILALSFSCSRPAGTTIDDGTLYHESLRPAYHFTSKSGWLNDPNGLVWKDGEWHLFYQHNPFGWDWGNMTWGHAVSPDLVHWNELGDAIKPDSLGTIFSGSAVVDHNNTSGFGKDGEAPLLAIYTSAGKPFTQSIAYSLDNGRTMIKYDGNPVIDHIIADNRDPKASWYEKDKCWVMAMYLTSHEYALFTSKNFKEWNMIQRLKLEGADECPDFFEIPVENEPGVTRWVYTGANSSYIVGVFDGKTFTPLTKAVRSDVGKDLYAVQSYSDAPDGRRVQVGWTRCTDFVGMPFNQQMAFPREMKLFKVDGGYVMKSLPVKELKNIYGKRHVYRKVKLGDAGFIPSLDCRSYSLKTTFAASEAPVFKINGMTVSHNSSTGKFTVVSAEGKNVGEFAVQPDSKGLISIWILADIGSVEIFTGDGETSATYANVLPEGSTPLAISSSSAGLLRRVEVTELKPIH